MSSAVSRACSSEKKSDKYKKSRYDKIRAAFGLDVSKNGESGNEYI
jgi:hypothetical protein